MGRKKFTRLEKFITNHTEREDIEKYAPTKAEAIKWGLIKSKRKENEV